MTAIAAECTVRQIPLRLDLAHAVGKVLPALHDWGVEFAVWCHYKFLSCGPGAVAGLFLYGRHADGAAAAPLQRHAGWWAPHRATRFAMPRTLVAQRGAHGFQVSNPPVLAVLPVIEALRALRDAGGVQDTRAKRVRFVLFMRK